MLRGDLVVGGVVAEDFVVGVVGREAAADVGVGVFTAADVGCEVVVVVPPEDDFLGGRPELGWLCARILTLWY